MFTRFLIACLVFIPAALSADQEHTYQVRGTIVKLPDPQKPQKEVMIKHEPIPDYVDSTGEKVGMKAMTMPFYLADGVSLEDLKVGDSVEFTYLSRWKPTPIDKVTAIKKIEGAALKNDHEHAHHHDNGDDHDHHH